MTILQKILDEKYAEVALLLEKNTPLAMNLPIHSLYARLINQNRLQVISEIKRASPSKGMINETIDPVKQAKLYEAAGAACISVLTDQKFFKGSFEDLRKVAEAVKIPVLCKDFIVHQIQIDYARAAGASVILLIVAALEQQQLQQLYTYAKSLGLDVLVEVHNIEEYNRAKEIDALIIGVNNRNLKTFEVDLKHTAIIAAQSKVTDKHVLISESGIKDVLDARKVSEFGASAILVGETLMKAADVTATLKKLSVEKQVVSHD